MQQRTLKKITLLKKKKIKVRNFSMCFVTGLPYMSKTILKHQYKWFVEHVNNTNKNIQTGHILFKTSNNLVW